MVSLKTFRWVCLKESKSALLLDTLLTYVVLGTTIGARLGHCFFYEPVYFLNHPLEIFYIWQGGLASHGGGIGVLLAIWLFAQKYKYFQFMWIIDRVSPMVAFTGGLIRIGNLMNSEIIGKRTDVFWAFIFDRVDQIPRHPTQIYESISYFFVALVGLSIYRRESFRPPKGRIFGATVSLIFIFRIIWEAFKENQELFEASLILNMGQILSLPYILVGLLFLIRSYQERWTQV